jgi:hypothetical protein
MSRREVAGERIRTRLGDGLEREMMETYPKNQRVLKYNKRKERKIEKE